MIKNTKYYQQIACTYVNEIKDITRKDISNIAKVHQPHMQPMPGGMGEESEKSVEEGK